MVQGNATLVVDLGNSSTKCAVLFGKDSNTGRYREARFDLSNQFSNIEPDYEVPSDYSDTTSTILRVDAEVQNKKVKGCFCNGELQQRERPSGILRPTATRKKYQLDTTPLSFELAFLHAYKEIKRMSRSHDISELDITWTVVTLLPPADVDAGKSEMENIVRSIKYVDSIFPACKIELKIDKVHILPEGYCAYIGTVFDKGVVIRPDYKFLINETVIIFDVGAGTTDCVLIKDGKLVHSSRYTVNKGGNNVLQIVKGDLEYEGIELDDAEVQSGVINGVVKDGAVTRSIVDFVNKATSEVASIIINGFTGHIERTDIRLRSVGYVLVCGGGSITNPLNNSITPLSASLVENFKELSPNSKAVEIPSALQQVEDVDGSIKKVDMKINPRDLNLIGATIIATNL